MTANRVREIALNMISEAAGDWGKTDLDNARNAYYIAGICALCEAICEAICEEIEMHLGE